MKKEDQSIKERENMLKYLGKMYRQASLRTECNYLSGKVSETNCELRDDITLLHVIDTKLSECGRDTRIIIKSSFLDNSDQKWYLDYYTKSTYYRLKRKAIDEFLDCLNV